MHSNSRRLGFVGRLLAPWLLILLTATSAEAQLRAVDVGVGGCSFLYEPRERWPLVAGRLRFGAENAPREIALTGTWAFDPLFGATWSEFGASVLTGPRVLRGIVYAGAGYSVLTIDMGAGSGSAHGAHGLAGVRLGGNGRRSVSLEARGLLGPARRRQDTSPEPVRTLTAVLSATWRR